MMGRRAPGARTALALGVCLLGIIGSACAETLLQLNGRTSYVEATGLHGIENGIFSMGIWFWPERNSDMMESILSVATSDKKHALTIGWMNAGMALSNPMMLAPVVSEAAIERKAWHYVVLTLDPIDRGSYQDPFQQVPAHRLGRLYVDGTVVLTFESRIPHFKEAVVTVGMQYVMGQPSHFFTGLVDELRLYNASLTETEVDTYTFVKPADAMDAVRTNKLIFYAPFNDIKKADIRETVIKAQEIVQETRTDVYYCEKVHVSVMPYDPLKVTSFSRENPMQYALYDAATTGPLSGATMTVMGSNIANTSFLGVYVNGSAGNVHFVNSSLVNVDLPPASIPASESYADYTVYVCNGGRGPGGNCATFPFRYEYVLGEGWSSSVSAFYKFEGDLENAAHRAEWKMRGKIPKNYGDGGPFFTENKQGYPMQALKFVRGERVETPVLIGQAEAWSMCSWFMAEPAARTLYYERDAQKMNVANLIQLDADGVIYLDGEPGANVTFSVWQFVCIAKTAHRVEFYVSGNHAGSAASVATIAVMDTGLIGTNWTGVVDDFWVVDYAVTAYDVMAMYANEEFSVALDGTSASGFFTITNDSPGAEFGSLFDSSMWRGTNTFSLEMWVNPSSVANQQPLLYQPSEIPSTAIESATTENYDGIYVSIENGYIVVFGVVSSAVSPVTYNLLKTQNAVAVVNTWMLVSVAFGASGITVFINGVAQSVTASLLSGNFATSYSSTTSLQASTKPMYVGYGSQYDVFDGYFAGQIAEVRLWTKTLDASMVVAGGECPPVPGVATGLYAYFKLDDAAGTMYWSTLTSPAVKMAFSGPKAPFWMAANYSSSVWLNKTVLSMPDSMASGFGLAYGYIERNNSFSFQARDECKRLLKYEKSDMQVVVGGPLSTNAMVFQGAITANGDGTYSGAYSTTTCGFYSIRVENTDVPLPSADNGDSYTVFSGAYDSGMAKGSPYKTYVEPGPMVSSMSYAYDEPDLLSNNDLAVAYYGAPSSFTVQAVDKYGCKITKGGETFDVHLTGRTSSEGMFTDNGDGTYTVTYVPYLAGMHQLSVVHKGEHIGTKDNDDPKSSCGVSLGSGYGGSPWNIDVQQGDGSIHFDGTNCIELDSQDQLNPGFEFTLEAFVSPLNPFTNGRIVSKESPTSGRGFFLAMHDTMLSASVYVGSDEGYRTVESHTKLPPGSWTHVAVTYNGTALKIFINGRQDAVADFVGRKDLKENNQKLKIGMGYRGLIDEVRMMPYAKSMEAVMEGQFCPMEADKVSMYLMMNDGAGEMAWDFSQYANHAKFCKTSSSPVFVSDNAPSGVNKLSFEMSEMSGDGLHQDGHVGVSTSFRVDLKDECGFDYSVKESVAVDIGIDNTTLFTDRHGVATCPDMHLIDMGAVHVMHEPNMFGVGPMLVEYEANRCGDALVAITADGMMNTPVGVYITPSETTASGNSVLMDLPFGAVPGLDTSFSIQAYDKFGCKRTTGGDTFGIVLTRTSAGEARMRGPDISSSSPKPVDNGDGSYTVFFNVPGPGSYVLDVGYDDGMGLVALEGSPHHLTASAAPWRSTLLSTEDGPAKRYDPTTVVYGEDMYVFRGFAEDKTSMSDVWKYPLSKADTWAYRSLVSVNNVRSRHEIKVTVDTLALVGNGKMRSDCADVMFLPVDAAPGSEPIPYYLDMHPGCNGTTTGFWISAPSTGSFHMYMYYGNAHATTSAESDGQNIMTSFDDFENSSPFDHGWNLSEACTMPEGDETAFTNDGFVSVTGSKALRVDAATKVGGALVKELEPMNTWAMKAFLWDSDATSSQHWISPNYEDCTDMGNDKPHLSNSSGLGVFTCTTEEYMAMLYPWSSTPVERSCGWKALEMICDGDHTHYWIDSVYMGARGPTSLSKILIRGGGSAKSDDQSFDSIAAWDTIYVAKFDPEVTVVVSDEEPVQFTHKMWSSVATRGTTPPTRSTKSVVSFEGRMYMLGGFGSEIDDGQVWYFDFPTSRWGSKVPWGSSRMPMRDDHSLVLSGSTIYVYGGRSGNHVFGDVWAYDVLDNVWTWVADGEMGPAPRFAHSAAVYKSTMYVFGGLVNGTVSNEMWGFDLKMGRWIQPELTPSFSPEARASQTISVQGASLFMYGGATADMVLKDAWKYDFEYNRWTRIMSDTDLGSRSEMGVAVYNNQMFVFGGHCTNSYYKDLWSLAVY